MEAKLIVTMELKEVQDAVIKAAREKIGDPNGSSSIRFHYDEETDAGLVAGAEVSFQYVKK